MKLIKEIRSKEGILHFKRWRVLTTPWFDINIHGIYKEDQDPYLHNHPWKIWTMILKGGYYEERHGGECRLRVFGHMSYCKTSDFHKIRTMRGTPTYSLAITGKRNQDWGYMINGRFIDHKTFRENKNDSTRIKRQRTHHI
jgi:hypothetical protein